MRFVIYFLLAGFVFGQEPVLHQINEEDISVFHINKNFEELKKAIQQLLPVGTILPFAGDRDLIPIGWLLCDGKPIPPGSEYDNLRKVLNHRFGVEKLPDLRGRATIGAGKGTGLTDRNIGETTGEENHILTEAEMPRHTHDYRMIIKERGNNTAFGKTGDRNRFYYNQSRTKQAGAGNPHNNMQPSLVVNFIIKAK